jgi:hypothetical protein
MKLNTVMPSYTGLEFISLRPCQRYMNLLYFAETALCPLGQEILLPFVLSLDKEPRSGGRHANRTSARSRRETLGREAPLARVPEAVR